MRGAGFERTGDLQGNSYQGDADVQTLAGRSACVRFNTREYPFLSVVARNDCTCPTGGYVADPWYRWPR